MEIKIRDHLTIAELRQAIFEQLHMLESDLAVRFSRGATLYVNPTNEHGAPVMVRGETGREVKSLYVRGPYRSAADDYNI